MAAAGMSAGSAGPTAGGTASLSAGSDGSGASVAPSGGASGSADQTSRDGGLSDAAMNAAPDPCAGAAFCETFEDPEHAGALDPSRWAVVTPNCSGTGAVAVDAEVAHGGTRSLRVNGGAGYCNHVFAAPTAEALAPSDPLHVRFYVRFEQALGASHVTFLAMRDAAEGKDLRMGGQSEILMWNRESDDATLPELSPAGIALSVKPAPSTWLCVELMIDAGKRELRTSVDGEPVPGLVVQGEPTQDIDGQWQNKPDWQPRIEDLKLGWESYGDAANTLWFDDVAVSDAPLGCGR